MWLTKRPVFGAHALFSWPLWALCLFLFSQSDENVLVVIVFISINTLKSLQELFC